jgi:hypothetical protein
VLVYKVTNAANRKVYIGKTIRSLSHTKARHYQRAKFTMRFSSLTRVTALASCCLASGLALAQDEEAPSVIRFPAGRSSTTIEGAVIRGERELYSVRARAGQTMTVSVAAIERNAVFDIYAPGARIGRDEDGILDVRGTELTPPNTDVRSWKGRLPADGSYLIVVGGTRGNAIYKLKVRIQ